MRFNVGDRVRPTSESIKQIRDTKMAYVLADTSYKGLGTVIQAFDKNCLVVWDIPCHNYAHTWEENYELILVSKVESFEGEMDFII